MDLSLRDTELEDRYLLKGTIEVLSVLNNLIRRRENVTVYFDQGRDFILTTLLEARASRLVFDLGSDERTNQRLQQSMTCRFVSLLDGIRIQFSASTPVRFSWDGMDAFCVQAPDEIMRLQRRETFRLTLPVGKPVNAHVLLPMVESVAEYPIHDLSVGGLAFTTISEPSCSVGDEAMLSFNLSKNVCIQSEVVIRHITPFTTSSDLKKYRVGVSFTDLRPMFAKTIQVYLAETEAKRRLLLSR
jgi:c-di-GMP-binding flagellar brake protein YcgR